MAMMEAVMTATGGADSNLPENNQVTSMTKSSVGMSAGMKVVVNGGLQIARQYAQKAIGQVGSLYGDKVLQQNINEASKLTSYAAQIISTGWVGVGIVGAEIAYNAVMNDIKDKQAVAKAEFVRSNVGYVANGAGRYNNE